MNGVRKNTKPIWCKINEKILQTLVLVGFTIVGADDDRIEEAILKINPILARMASTIFFHLKE